MLEGGNSKNSEVKNTDTTEAESTESGKVQKGLSEIATKLTDLLFSDDHGESKDSNNKDVKDESESKSDSKESNEGFSDKVKQAFEELFSTDNSEKTGETAAETQETNNDDSGESNLENKDPLIEKIAKSIGTPEGIKALIEKHPEKAELWKNEMDALDTLNDPDASPAEIRSAQAKLSVLKGQLLETAVKDALAETGLDVEAQQRVVEGESGGTRPDVIAKNNTDHPIVVFGETIMPGETMCVECKCGGSAYMTNQLNNHIPNQLSGQEGTKVLLTTSDIKDSPTGLASNVCSKYRAKLVVPDVSVSDVENAIKEVAANESI